MIVRNLKFPIKSVTWRCGAWSRPKKQVRHL